MNRLNGWQRLWVLFSSIVLSVICALTFILWPTQENTYHRDEFYASLSPQAKSIIIGVDELERKYGFVPESKGEKGERDNLPNGHTIIFSSKSSEKERYNAVQEYWGEVAKETNKERWLYVWYAFSIWASVSIAVYIFGFAVAWVIAGFKKHRD